MLKDWLSINEKSPPPYKTFRVIDVSENKKPDSVIMEYLGKEILSSFRNIDELKLRYENSKKEDLISYIENYIFPSEEYQIVKNVKQGDFAEFLSSLIVTYFQKLIVPIHKMRWKFNKDRSVFCTDMMAHNVEEKITDLYYYEIKSRQNSAKENVGDLRDYITVHAHNSLLKDEQSPNEAIADFLSRLSYEMGDFDSAKKYGEIVKNPDSYRKHFELFFIIEKNNYKVEILKALEELPPTLTPLCVTLILIDNLKLIVSETYAKAIENAIAHVYPVRI